MAMEMWHPMGSLTRRNPFQAMERQMEDVFDRMLRSWPGRRLDADLVGWVPPLDMINEKNEIVVRVDLPGLDRKDIELSAENGILTLQGSRQQEKHDKAEELYAVERWAGAFTRSVALPQGVDPERIQASFKNGVLEVRVPKTKEVAGKKIDIKAA